MTPHTPDETAAKARAQASSAAVSAARVITVTVSDTRTIENDASGKALMEELAAFTHVRHVIVPDDVTRITSEVQAMVAKGEADGIVLTGGTGIAPRDLSYEALSRMFDKTLDGFGEAFRRLSWEEIGPRAILSRATAGTIGTCLVFLVPGSEKAARLGARALIAPILKHAVDSVNGRTHHPAATTPPHHREEKDDDDKKKKGGG